MSQTTLYPWGREKPPVFLDNEDKILRRFKSVCAYNGLPMNKQVQQFTIQYIQQVGIEPSGDPYRDFKKACEATQSAMIQQVKTMMEEFIKHNRIR